MMRLRTLSKLEGYAVLAAADTQDDVDIKALSEEYANSAHQLGSWYGSLLNTDYGYKFLKRNGYTDDQIAPWVRRTGPAPRNPTPDPPPITEVPQPDNQLTPPKDRQPPPKSDETPKDTQNKATLSNEGLQQAVGAALSPIGAPTGTAGLTQEQLGQLGLMRAADGQVYSVQNTRAQLNPVTEE